MKKSNLLIIMAYFIIVLLGCSNPFSDTPEPPSAPECLDALSGDSQVVLSWASVTGATGYNLYWSTEGG